MQAAWLASVQSTTPPTLPSHPVSGTVWESTQPSTRAFLPRLQSWGKRHLAGTASAIPAAPVQQPGALRQALSLLPLPAGSANAEGAFSHMLSPCRLLIDPLLPRRICSKLETCRQGAALAAECSCARLRVKRTPCSCQDCLYQP